VGGGHPTAVARIMALLIPLLPEALWRACEETTCQQVGERGDDGGRGDRQNPGPDDVVGHAPADGAKPS
jgi:hypothetical protein